VTSWDEALKKGAEALRKYHMLPEHEHVGCNCHETITALVLTAIGFEEREATFEEACKSLADVVNERDALSHDLAKVQEELDAAEAKLAEAEKARSDHFWALEDGYLKTIREREDEISSLRAKLAGYEGREGAGGLALGHPYTPPEDDQQVAICRYVLARLRDGAEICGKPAFAHVPPPPGATDKYTVLLNEAMNGDDLVHPRPAGQEASRHHTEETGFGVIESRCLRIQREGLPDRLYSMAEAFAEAVPQSAAGAPLTFGASMPESGGESGYSTAPPAGQEPAGDAELMASALLDAAHEGDTADMAFGRVRARAQPMPSTAALQRGLLWLIARGLVSVDADLLLRFHPASPSGSDAPAQPERCGMDASPRTGQKTEPPFWLACARPYGHAGPHVAPAEERQEPAEERRCLHCGSEARTLGPIGMWQHCPSHNEGALCHEWTAPAPPERPEAPACAECKPYWMHGGWHHHNHAAPAERIGGLTREEWQAFSRELWEKHNACSPTALYPLVAAAFRSPKEGQE
jgi:hypothetical protein